MKDIIEIYILSDCVDGSKSSFAGVSLTIDGPDQLIFLERDIAEVQLIDIILRYILLDLQICLAKSKVVQQVTYDKGTCGGSTDL